MEKAEKQYCGAVKCGHCNNLVTMQKLYTYPKLVEDIDPKTGESWESGDVYELLICPACNSLTFWKYFWREWMDPSEVTFDTLFPVDSKVPIGMPESVKTAYIKAQNIKSIDPDAYAVLVRRLLECVCKDRNASGKYLNDKLTYLADKGEIPANLVAVANSLKDFGNIGAHADLGDLPEAEVPILENLADAILAYIYSAPYLANAAQGRINALKQARNRKDDDKNGAGGPSL